MSDAKKSVWAATSIVLSVAAVFGGLKVRQHTDIGSIQAVGKDSSTSHMLASRSNEVNVPAADYFYELSLKLKEQYVEPVSDDQKLASGAIRGMVASLGDPDSVYMDNDQFKAFLNARVGKFEGIGADLVLTTESHAPAPKTAGQIPDGEMGADEALVFVREIPKVQVASIVPGGPADRAGVQVGDTVESIDDHWVVHSDLIRKFRLASKKFNDKKITRLELEKLRTELRAKFERSIFPGKAKDRLFMGKSGVVNVVWNRSGSIKKTRIVRAPSSLEGFSDKQGTIRIPFVEKSADQLKAAIRGKGSITIDLRNNTLGDVQAMKQCLDVLVPKGTYGYFVTKRHDKPTPLIVQKGNPNPPKIRLVVDRSTRGIAEAFASALVSKGVASGSTSEMGGDPCSRQVVQLQDGSGYTLVTSKYQASVTSQVVSKRGGVK